MAKERFKWILNLKYDKFTEKLTINGKEIYKEEKETILNALARHIK